MGTCSISRVPNAVPLTSPRHCATSSQKLTSCICRLGIACHTTGCGPLAPLWGGGSALFMLLRPLRKDPASRLLRSNLPCSGYRLPRQSARVSRPCRSDRRWTRGHFVYWLRELAMLSTIGSTNQARWPSAAILSTFFLLTVIALFVLYWVLAAPSPNLRHTTKSLNEASDRCTES